MTTTDGWTAADLAAVDDTAEIHVASRRGDGTLRPARIVWVVRHDDALYVRSVNGPGAAWYRGVQARHHGVIGAGQLQRDVTFVEADHTPANALDDLLDAAYLGMPHDRHAADPAGSHCRQPPDAVGAVTPTPFAWTCQLADRAYSRARST